MPEEITLDPVETALSEAAPALPQDLRLRTLARCAQRSAAHRARQRRLQRQCSLGVMAVLALQTVTISLLDAQSSELIAGNSHPPLMVARTWDQWVFLVRERSRVLASLFQPGRIS